MQRVRRIFLKIVQVRKKYKSKKGNSGSQLLNFLFACGIVRHLLTFKEKLGHHEKIPNKKR